MRLIVGLVLLASLVGSQTKISKTYILVNGAWHDSSVWDKVTPMLVAKGHKVHAVDLPGQKSDDTTKIATLGLSDYVQAVVEQAKRANGQVILVGHSMAGVVIAQAAEILGPDKVSSLVFLDAFMPRNGQSVFSMAQEASKNSPQPPGTSVVENLEFASGSKISKVKREAFVSLFCDDCSAADKNAVIKRVVWQPMRVLGEPVSVTGTRYGVIPKYYILCTRAKDLNKQSISTNVPTKKIFKLESSHSPFLSMPSQVVEILMDL